MKRNLVVLACLMLLGLYALMQWPGLFLDPGPLTRGHAKLEGKCFQCHSPFQGPRNGSCVACHPVTGIGAGKPGKASFHQRLAEGQCVACHTDHQGVDASRATRKFAHGLLAPDEKKQCAQCHLPPRDTLHQGAVGQCSGCHGEQRWKPATLDHDRFFRFDRDHPPRCADCHPRGDYRQTTCYGCHEHSPGKIRQEHVKEGIQNYERCGQCHRSADEDEAKGIMRSLPETPAPSGQGGEWGRGSSHPWLDQGPRGDHDDDEEKEDD